jgi:hypothetical protein
MRGCLSGATPRLLSCGHRPHAQARYHNDEEASTTGVSRRVAAARRSKTWLLALSIGILAPAALLVAALALMRPAVALPSFARQTGFECAACHVAFPELRRPAGSSSSRDIGCRAVTLPCRPSPAFFSRRSPTPKPASPAGSRQISARAAISPCSRRASFMVAPSARISASAPSPRRPMTAPPIASAGTTSISASPAPERSATGISSSASVNNNPTVQDVWNTTPACRFPFPPATPTSPPRTADPLRPNRPQSRLGARLQLRRGHEERWHRWDEQNLDRYLADPKAFVPGNKMPYFGVKRPETRKDIISYLSTLR